MKSYFNHDERKKCVIVNASELGRLLLYYYYTSLPAHHEYAISCHFPYYFTLYISDNTAKKSELKTEKVGTCQDDDFFCFVIPVWSVLKIVQNGMEVSFGMHHTPGRVLQWGEAK